MQGSEKSALLILENKKLCLKVSAEKSLKIPTELSSRGFGRVGASG